MAKFVAPVIQDNPSGWGPCAVPEQFKDMPYQPFSKGDRLGKVPVLCWAMSSGCLWLPSPAHAACGVRFCDHGCSSGTLGSVS